MALSALIAALYAISLTHNVLWISPSGHFWLLIRNGQTTIQHFRLLGGRSGGPPGWEWPDDFGPRQEPVAWGFSLDRSSNSLAISVPNWAPLLATVLPTAYAWHRCRRVPRGHCAKCGYDLAGITNNICPECGNASDPMGAAA